MVAIVRLEGYEKLVYMRHFSEKATGRRTGVGTYTIMKKKNIMNWIIHQGERVKNLVALKTYWKNY